MPHAPPSRIIHQQREVCLERPVRRIAGMAWARYMLLLWRIHIRVSTKQHLSTLTMVDPYPLI